MKAGSAGKRRRPVVEEIEPRILYSADFAPGLVDTATLTPSAEQRTVDTAGEFIHTSAQDAQTRRHELVLVETNTPDYQKLVDAVVRHAGDGRDIEVVLLDASKDGIQQVTDILAERKDLSAVHLISHGADGQVQLGTTRLDFDTLLKNAVEIKGWGKAFAVDGDLLIYGCDVAQHQDGKSLIDALSRLTGADVAASEDTTGAASNGGNWTLEYEYGVVQAQLVFNQSMLVDWNGALQATAQGAETLANTATGNTQDATTTGLPRAVATDANGNFVVVWASNAPGQDGSGYGIYAQRFNAAGAKVGTEFKVNNTTAADQTQPSVAMDANGNFVVAWTSNGQDGSALGVYAQRFNASGATVGGEFRVNSTTASDQFTPIVAMNATGNFVVMWTSSAQDGSGYGVFAKRYNASGVAQSGDLQINSNATGDQWPDGLVVDAGGNFIATFASSDPGGWGVYAARYDLGLNVVLPEVRVNTTTAGDQDNGAIAMDSSGNYVVVWRSAGQDGSGTGIYAQRYNASGTKIGGEIAVNTTAAGDQTRPEIAMDAGGRFVVTWSSYGQDAAGTWGVYQQEFYPNGTKNGGEVRVSGTTGGNQQNASVSMTAQGDFVVVWSGNGAGDTDGVFFQRYISPGVTISQTSGLTTTEAGGTASFTVVLDRAPTSTVTIALASSDTTEGTVSASSLTFTTANWNTAQTVTVTGIDDAFSDGGIGYTIVTGAAASTDLNYNGLTVADVTLTNTDTTPSEPARTINEDGSQVFSAAGGNAVNVTDGTTTDSTLRVQLTVTNGIFTLSQTTGLTFISGANGTSTMTVQGLESNINAALNGSVYAPTANYNGSASLQVTTTRVPDVTAQYTFENAGSLATDATGTYNGTLGGSGTTGVVDATRGNVANLTGAGYVQTTGHFGNPASVTLGAWVNLTAADTGGAEVISLGDSAGIRLDDSVGGVTGFMYNGTTWQNTRSSRFVAGTGWHYVAYTFDNTSKAATLYLDGTVVASATLTGSITYNQGPNSFIGKHGNSGTNHDFNGRIDDVRVYNRALSATEIAALAADAKAPTQSVAITVTAVNDAPTRTAASVSLAAVAEDTANPAGATVSSLFTSAFSDATDQVSGGSSANTLAGVAVTANAANNGTEGRWQWYNGAAWVDISTSVSTSSALVLASGTSVRFLPNADYSGTPGSLTVRLIDSSGSAVAGTTVDVTTSGGTTRYSDAANAVTLTTSVTAVNDAPVLTGANNLTAISEDPSSNTGTLVSALLSGKVTDADSGALSGIAVTALVSTNGAWQYSTNGGSSWTAFGAVGNSSALLLKADASTYVRFVPNANWNGTVTPGITFRAWDQTSGTAGNTADTSTNGGSSAFSSATASASITVNAVNDAPTRTAASVSLAAVAEDTANPTGATVSALFTAAFSDATDQVTGGSSANTLAGVAVSANAANSGTEGRWQWYNGTSWVDISTSASTSSALVLASGTSVRFLPNADYNGTPGSLTVRLIDSSGGVVTSGATVNVTTSGGTTQYSDAANAVTLATSVSAVNDAPVLTGANNLTAINEDPVANPGTLVSALISGRVSDADGSALTGIAVTAVDNTNGTWQYSTNGGSAWTAFGSPSGASARLLAADANTYVRFVPNANWNGTVAPGITFRAWDQTSGTAGNTADTSTNGGSSAFSSATASASITVTAVNDAPTRTAASVSLAGVAEDTANPTGATVSALFTSAFSDATDQVTGGSAANTLAGVAVTANAANSGTQGRWQWYNGTSWVDISTSASTSSALVLASGTSVRFLPNADYNGTPGSLSVRLIDNSAGVVSSGATVNVTTSGGTTQYSDAANAVTLATSVTAVNDAPVLTGANNLTAINEDPVANPGTLVSALIAGQVSDVDSGALSGIAVTGVDNANGAWQYSTNGGTTWNTFATPTPAIARLLAADASTYVRFVPNANWNGTVTPGITFRAWDQTSGTAGNTADTTSNGGTTAFSSATASANITVNAVNDAPTNTVPAAQGTSQNTALVFSSANGNQISIADLDAGASPVQLTLTATFGTITLNGSGGLSFTTGDGTADATMTFTGTLVNVNTALNGLSFNPNTGFTGAASLTINTNDQGNTGSGGAQSANSTVNITVNAALAPTASNDVFTVNEDNVLSVGPVGVLQNDNAPSGQPMSAVLVGGPAHSSAFTLNANGTFTYTPVVNFTGTDTFTYRANDGINNSNLATVTITVNPVNDAPAGTSKTVTTLEDIAYAFTVADFGFTDPDDSPANSLTAVRISTLPGAGSLTNNGVALSAGQSVTLADILAGYLQYAPAADANGVGYASFTFQVQDDGGTANSGVNLDASARTMSINVTPVNDAPVLTGANNLAAIDEDPVADSGTLVSALIAGQVSDVDSAATGIAVTAVDNTNGTWQYSTDGGTIWTAFGSPSAASARLLAADVDTYVRFVPNANWNGTLANGITFRAWDQTGGTAGATADTSSNGGSSAFSSATASAGITVNALNDAPLIVSVPPSYAAVEQTPLDLAGSISITDLDAGVGNIQTTLSVVSGTLTATPGILSVTISGSGTDTLTLTGTLTNVFNLLQGNGGATLSYVIGSDAPAASDTLSVLVDDQGNSGLGGVKTATANITINVSAVNDAPTIANGATMSLSGTDEDTTSSGTSVDAILGGADWADGDSAPAKGIAVTAVSGNGTWQYSTNGIAWTNFGSVSGSSALLLDSATQVRYMPDGQNGETASFAFRAWDQTSGSASVNGSPSTADPGAGGGSSAYSAASASATIVVGAVNDAPVLDNSGTMTLSSIDEDALSNSGDLVSAIVASAGGDRITDVDSAAVEGIAVTALVSGNGTWQYSTDGGTSWNSVGTVSNASALLLRASDRLRFVPDGLNADSPTVSFRAWDQSSGTAGNKVDVSGNGGTSAFSSAIETASITVTAVNDAPVLAAAVVTLNAVNEDAGAPVGAVGTLVSALMGGVSDVDSGALGIAITAADISYGSWFYSTNSGASWTALVGPDAANSRLLAADAGTRIYFRPNADYNGTIAAALSFRAWDQSSGSNGATADTTTNGGTSAFSSDTANAAITVNALNDLPVAVDDSASTDQNTVLSVPANGVLSNDSDIDGDTLFVSAVEGNSGDVGNSISLSSGALLTLNADGSYSYDPNGQFDSLGQGLSTTDSFVYTVSDGNGGSIQASVIITIDGRNDAPTLTNGFTVGLSGTGEDTASSATTVNSILTSAGWADVDSGALKGIAVTAVSGNGAWQYSTDGTTWTDFGSVSSSAALLLDAATQVRYVPDGQNGETADFSFRAWDQSAESASADGSPSTANPGAGGGSSAYSVESASASIVVGAVNDAPSIGGVVAGQTVNDTATISPFAGVTIGDVDNPAQTLSVSVTLDVAAKGTFTTLNGFTDAGGGVYTFNGTAAAATAAIQGLVFDPADDRVTPGSTETTIFTISVDDGSGPVTDSTTTVVSSSVNDAPSIGGVVAGQTVNDTATISPFAAVTIGDADNPAQTLSVSVALDVAAKGTFTTLNGFTDAGGGVYTFSGTAAAATTAIQGLVFDSADNRVTPGSTETTIFTISVDDGVAAPVTDSTTTVVSTSVNDASSISGTLAGQAVNDNATISPFAGVTIGDVDNPAQTLSVSVSLDLTAKGAFTTLNGFTNAGGGLYTFTGTAAAASTAIQGLVFDPADNRVTPGSTETTTFSISVDDGSGPVTDATTTVVSTSVNDAPTLTTGATVVLTGTDEDTPSSGATVSSMLTSAGWADVDSSALKGIAVTAVTGNGSWEYSTDGSIWTAFGSVSGSAALLLDAGTQVRYGPDGQNGETATFSFRAWDQTSGTASGNGSPSIANPGAGGASSAYSSQSAGASIVVSAVNDAPSIGGAVAGQAVNDTATISPFAAVTIGDVDNPAQTVNVSVTLDSAAKGAFSTLNGFTDAGGGVYTFTGTAAAATTAIQGLVFDPADDRVTPGSTETTLFTISVDDGSGPVTDSTTTVVSTSVNDAPSIGGAVAGQTVNDTATISPFAGVTIGDVDNPAQTVNVSVTLDSAAKGVFSVLNGFTDAGGGVYTFSGTAAAATTAIQGLVFDPTDNRVTPGSTETTIFSISVDDGVAAPVTDSTTTVVSTSVNDAPSIGGVVAGQTVNDTATLNPFAGVTIGDVDNPAQILDVSVTLDSAAKGVFSVLNGFTDAGGGVYTFTGTAAAATTAIRGLVFDPADNRVSPGSSETTTLTISVDDGVAAPVTDSTTTVVSTSVNDASSISGTVAGQAVNDTATLNPFAGMTIGDVDNPAQILDVSVTLDSAAKGVFSVLSGFTDAGGGVYTFSGTAAAATTAIQGLVFDPTDNRVTPGSTETTTFTISVDDGSGPVSDATTTVVSTSVNDAPSIGGAVAGQTVNDTATISPFAAVTIGDVDNPAQTVNVSVTLDAAAKGAFSTLNGFTDAGGGVYTFTGTVAAATTAIQGLVFDPADNRVTPGNTETTTFTISVDDGVAAPVNNSTTTVVSTSVNDASSISGTVGGQAVNDNATVNPFAGVTIGDVDNPAQTLNVSVTLDSAAKGAFSTLNGFTDAGGGLYTFNGTAAAATAAIQGLVFDPADNRVTPGSTETTIFSISVDDGVAAPVTDSTTTVVSTSVNDAPSIGGVVAGQTVNDTGTLNPFAGVTIGDVDNPAQTVNVSVTLDAAAKGAFSTLNGFTDAGGGVYTFTGTAAAATTAIQGLVFDPTDNRVTPGSTETTTFTISVDDGSGPVSDATTTVVSTSVNDVPSIGGAVAGQTVNDTATISPFAAVTIGDVDNPAQTVNVSVTLDAAAKGAFSTLNGFTNAGGGLYTFTGTVAAATTAIQGLVFDPADNRVTPGNTETTIFTISVDDGVAAPVTDSTTTVVSTSVNDASSITGTVAGQAVNDNATVSPFAGVTIGDVDNPAQTLSVSVSLDLAAKGAFSTLNGFANAGGGLYTFTGTAAAATTAIQGLVFDPTDNRVTPGSTETTTFTISVDDGSGPVSDATTTVVSTSVNDASSISGTVAGQAVNDTATVSPFAGVTIGDVDNPAQTLSVSVSLDLAAKGAFTTLNGFTDAGGGVYTFSGTAAAATTAIQGLVFDPADNRVTPGSTETTIFTISVDDGSAPVTDATTTVVSTSVNDAPSIGGVVAGQTVNDSATLNPFAGVTIGDVDNPAQILDVSVTLDDAAKGVFSVLSGFTDAGGGVYTFSGTAAAATTAIQGLVFDPADNRVAPGNTETTTFTISVDDGLAAPVTDSTTTVVSTSVNDAPSIGGAVAGQAVNDTATINPFGTVTIGDVDNPAQTVNVSVTLDSAAKGVFSVLSGFTDAGGGVYTFSGTAAAATTAIQGLVFDPADNRVVPGSTETTTFSISVDDGSGPVTDATTTVVSTSVNDASSISGTVAGQAVNDTATLNPFGTVTIGDVDNPAQSLSVSVALDVAAKGAFTTASLTTSGFTDAGGGIYTFSGTAAAATTAIQGLVFDPADNRVTPGNTETTTFTISVDDGVAAPVTDSTTTVVSTSVNDASSISGTVAGQPVNDTATVSPFAGVTIGDVDNPAQTLSVSVSVDLAAKGVFSVLSGFTDAGGGVYTFSGTAAAATTAIQGLVFDPADNRVAPGNTETTTFTISVDDGLAAPVTDSTTTVVSTSVNDAPSIGGVVIGQTVNDTATISPFAAVTIGDVDNPAQTVNVSVTLDSAAKGVFSVLSGFTDAGGGVYTFSGTAAAATTAIQGLVFDPADNRVAPGSTETTTFTISVDDGVAAPVTDSTTTVVSTSVNDASSISGVVAGQAVNDTATVSPFAGVTIGDVDNPAQTLSVSVSLDLVAKGAFTTLNGFTDAGGGVYTFTGTAAAATTAIQGLVFDPADNRVTPGNTETTTFTISVDDGVAAPVTDSTTTVVSTSVNDASSISGTVAGQPVNDTATVNPFAGVTIGDVDNPAQSLSVSVALDVAAKGAFTVASLTASGFVDAGGGVYTFSGTAAAATTAIQGLVFDPADNRVAPGNTETTTFTISVDDGVAAPLTDSTTTVVSTSVNDASSISGTVAGQAVNDTATVSPFAGVTIGDADNPAQALSVSVSLDMAAKGAFTTASLTASGFTDAGGGVYTFSGTAAAATTAIRGLVFDPADNRVTPGTTETTTFAISVDDGSGPVTDATTTVVSTSVNDASSISGAMAGQAVNDNATLNPFAGVTIGDVDNPAQSLSVSVALDVAAKGAFTTASLTASGFTDAGGGVYTFTGTAAAATTAIQGLVFDPADNRVAPGSTETTTFTISVDDGLAASVTDSTTTVVSTSVNDASSISGTVAGQPVNDTATISPFAVVTIGDVDNPAQTLNVSVTLDLAAKGAFTTLNGFTDAGGGVYTFTGTAAAATTAIQGLVFDPTDNRVTPGSTETTTFTISVDDGSGPVSDATTTVVSTSVNDASSISGTVAGQAVNDNATISLFAGVTIGDVDNPAQSLSVSVALDVAAKGAFTTASLTASGFTDAGGGVYTFTGTAAAATTAIQGLVFDPADNRVTPGNTETTTFTISVDDGVAAPVNNSTTTVVSTSVNDASSISGTVAGQPVNDTATISPFAGVTIGDVDNPAQTVDVSVTLDSAAKGAFTTASLTASGFTDAGGGVYTFTGTAAAATTAIQGLVFDPADNRVTPGNTETTTFTISVDDGVAAPVTDSTTTVVSTSVNDASSISGTVAGQPVNDTATVNPFAGVTIGDVDNPAQSLSVSVALDVAAKGAFTVASLTASGFVDAGGGVYTFSGTAAAATTAIQGLVFDPADNRVTPGNTETTTFTISVDDGVAAPVTDSTTTVVSTSVNDVPVAGDDAGTTDEDTVLNVAALGVLGNDSDLDGGTLTVSAVEGNPAAVGSAVVLSSGALLTLNADGSFDYDPNGAFEYLGAGESDVDTFTYEVSDGNGGLNTATVSITIDGVNDAPGGGDATVFIDEDGSYIFTTADFGFADADASDSLQGLRLVSLPGAGSLSLSGAGVSAGQLISAADLMLGNLVFTPAADANGVGYASFTFRVNDGTVDAPVANTVTIDVIAVNDAPGFTQAGDQNVNEDAGAQSVGGFANALPGGGGDEAGQTLTYSVSNDNNALFSVQPGIDAAGNLSYTLAADASGVANVTVLVSDNGGTTNGGADTSAAQLFTITVNAVNDAPTLTIGANQSVAEDAGAQTLAAFASRGPGGGPDEAGQALSYSLSNDNNALFALQPALDAAGNLVYTPAANASGVANVTVLVGDNGGTANGGVDSSAAQIFTITVNPVNDAPLLGANVLSIGQGGAVVLGAANLSASDVDDPAAGLMFSVSNVTNGRFELVSAPGAAIAGFTQADITGGLVRFVHDGSGNAAAYAVSVSDGALSDGPISASVSFAPNASSTPTPMLTGPVPVLVAAATLPPPPSASAPAATSQREASVAPARVIPAVFSPGRIDPPEAQLNDYQAQTVGFRRLIQPVATLNHFTPGPHIDPTLELLAALPANLEYLSTVPVDWSVRPAFPDAEDTPRDRIDVLLEQVQMGGMALSVGVVWWASRISGLLGSLLASAPAWRHIDPLPVVGRDEDEEKKWYDPNARDVDADELAVADVLEGGRVAGDERRA